MNLRLNGITTAALFTLAACSGTMDGDRMGAAAKPSLTTSPQPAGATLKVDAVTIASDGWLVIHATQDGKPVVPASIGHTAVKAGTSNNVSVQLSAPTRPGDVVITMLHADTGKIGTYEFGPGSVDNDKPIVDGGKPVVKPLKIQ